MSKFNRNDLKLTSFVTNFFNNTFFRSSLVVGISSLVVVSLTMAATTIGTNIITGGTLEAEGSYASTTGYLVIGTGLGALVPSAGDLIVSGNATTSGYFIIGAGEPGDNIPDLFGAGDLYVGGDATITNNLTVGSFIGVSGDADLLTLAANSLTLTGNATTSGYFIIGTGEPGDNIPDLFGAGDLYVGGDATITQNLLVSGYITGLNSATTTNNTAYTIADNSGNQVIILETKGAVITLPAAKNGLVLKFVTGAGLFAGTDFAITSAGTKNIHGTLIVNYAAIACVGEQEITFEEGADTVSDWVELTATSTGWLITGSNGNQGSSLSCT